MWLGGAGDSFHGVFIFEEVGGVHSFSFMMIPNSVVGTMMMMGYKYGGR